jgi:hypothetical protein
VAASKRLAVWCGDAEVTPRLVGLLKWMNAQPEIKRILDDLRNSGPVFEQLRAGGPAAFHQAAAAATDFRDVAAVGLAMVEICATPNQSRPSTLFHQIAHSFGLQAPPNRVDAADFLSDAAMERYVRPLLNYVVRKLPEDLPAGGVTSGQAFIPVAIQESLKAFQKDYPNPEKVAFIMMQFAGTSAHTGIEQAIKTTLAKYGFSGALARDKEYHEEMLPNIQT